MRYSLFTVRKQTREALLGSRNPIVLSSFGKDSMLLLQLVREVRPDIPVLWFQRPEMSRAERRFAESVIADWKLTVYGYAPADRYYVAHGEADVTLVDEYSIGTHGMPVLYDPSEGDRCGLELKPVRTPRFDYQWDGTLVGWKQSDEHPLVGQSPFPTEPFEMGPTTIHAPLLRLSDEQVWEAIRAMELPYDRERYDGQAAGASDEIALCVRCVREQGHVFCPAKQQVIPTAQWDREGSLRAFRERFAPQMAA